MRHAFWAAVAVVSTFVFAFFLQASIPQVNTNTWQSGANMTTARTGATATALPDGRILIVGGSDASGNPLASAEVLSTSGSFSTAASMSAARTGHAAILLSDGRVLVTGGTTTGGGFLSTAEAYDPASDSWQTVGSMSDARSGHSMSQLQDASVLVAGGTNSSGPVASLERYDGSGFSVVGTLNTPRSNHAAAVLQDGKVLIVGGNGVASDGSTTTLSSSEIYDPAAGSVSAGPNLNTPRAQATATTLVEGTVLVVGGNTPATAPATGNTDLASAEIYDPAAGTFTAASSSLATARSGHIALLLPKNNSVLIVGGTSAGLNLASAEMYVPATGAFQAAGVMTSPRSGAAAAAFTGIDGLAVVAGGQNGSASALSSSEYYGFATVKTDAADYPPGTTVNITGSGFVPGEAVSIKLVESPLLDTHGPYTVTADANGNISDSSFTTDIHDVNVKFYLTATGSQAVAENTFTDAPGDTTTTAVSCTPSSVAVNSPTTCTATVTDTTGSSNGAPQGDVTFAFSGTGSFTPGASCTVSPTPPSSTTVASCSVTLTPTAITSGNVKGNFNAVNNTWKNSTSSNFSLTVTCTAPAVTTQPTNQTITYGANATFTAVASGNPAPTVQWQSNTGSGFTNITGATSTTLTVTNPAVSASGTQYRAVFANSCGTGTATSNAATLTVNKATTSTTVTSSQNPSNSGQQVTFTATVAITAGSGTPTGTVQFKDGANNLGSAVALTNNNGTFTATFSTSTLSSASHSITAVYSGDANFTGSTSSALSQVVNNPATTTIVTSSLNPSTYGQAVTFTATVTSQAGTPTGSVAFYNGACGGTALTGSLSLDANGKASFSTTALAAGTYTITACYTHTGTFQDSNGSVSQQVKAAGLTITANSTSKTYGQTVTFAGNEFTASGLAGGDTVTSVTLTSAGAAASAGVGSYSIVASAAQGTGLANYTISYVNGTLTVDPAGTTISVVGSTVTYPASGLATVTVTSAAGTPTGNVSLSVNGGPAVSQALNANGVATFTLSGLPAATYTLSANYAAQGNFAASGPAAGMLTVQQAPLTITANDTSMSFGGSAPTFTASYSGLVNGDTSAVVSGLTFAVTNNGNPVTDFTTLKAGSYPIVPSGATAANYAIQYANGTLTVNKATFTGSVVVSPADPQNVPYGGTVTANVYLDAYSIGGVPVVQKHADPNDSSKMLPESMTVYLVPAGGSPSQAVKFGMSNASPTYDNTHNTTGTNKTGWTATIAGKAPAPGNYNVLVYGDDDSNHTLSSANPDLVDSGYFYPDTSDISYPTLTSQQLDVVAADLTITANSTSKTYGQTVTFAGTEFTTSGLVTGDTVTSVTLTSAGAAATAGISGSPYDIVPSNAVGTGLANYNVHYVNGKLTVNPAALTITAKDASKTYGQTAPFQGTEFTTSGLLNSDAVNTVTLTSAGAAATAQVNGSPYAIVPSAAVGTGLGNYTISYVNGALTVQAATLTLSVTGSGGVYNALPYPAACSITSGLVNGDQVTLTVTYSAGFVPVNVGSYTATCTTSGNSNYNVASGQTSIIISPAPLTITADDKSMTFGDATAPTFTASYSGFQGNDTPAVVSSLAFSVTNNNNSVSDFTTLKAGSYPIVPSGAMAANYAISFTKGTLTVNKAAVTGKVVISPVDPATVPYGGNVTATVYLDQYSFGGVPVLQQKQDPNDSTKMLPETLTVYLVPAGGSPSQAVKFGTATAVPTYDHTQNTSGTTKTGWTATISGKAPTVGNYNGFVYGDDDSQNSLSSVTPSLVEAGYFSPDTNDISYPTLESGQLDVVKAPLSVSIVGDPTKPYDSNTTATLTSANYQVSGLVGTDSITVTKTTGTYNSANVGSANTVSVTLAAGDYTAGAATSLSNYDLPTTASGPGHITQAHATISVIGYHVTYDATAHTASATATGAGGADLSTDLNLSATTHTNAGTYNGDAWSFHDPAGNYFDANGAVDDQIDKANANVSVTPYHVTYDGNAHTATGAATGVKGENLSGLDLSGTTHTSAGDYKTDGWTFTDSTGNYNNAKGTVEDQIDKANASIKVTPYSVTYDGNAHTATGTAAGVKGEALSGLDLSGTTHTTAKDYPTDSWTFTDVTGNYNNAGGTIDDNIAKADPTISVTGYSVTYDGNAHTAAGTATGAKGESLAGLDLSGTTHTGASDYPSDKWTFTDQTGNYNNASNTVHDHIDKAGSTTVVTFTASSYVYTGTAFTATASVTGVGGLSAPVTPVTYSGDCINVTTANGCSASATYAGDANHNSSSDMKSITITKANATITVTPYAVVYDEASHTATGSAVGVKGEALSGLNLSGTTHTNPGDYKNDPWTFTDVTGNYNNSNGAVEDKIQYLAGGLCDGDSGHTILQPVNADGTSTFKQGSTVPAKFRVCDAYGNSVGTAGVVTAFNLVSVLSGTTTQTVDETVVSTTPDTAFRWDATGQQWIFNISTKNLATHATYIYQIKLNDGSSIAFQYGLPK